MVHATRLDEASIQVDGALDPQEWGQVSPLPALMQVSPRYGASPSEPTTIRVAYDGRGVYVAFACHMDPDKIRAPFFVRDQAQPGDLVFWTAEYDDPERKRQRHRVQRQAARWLRAAVEHGLPSRRERGGTVQGSACLTTRGQVHGTVAKGNERVATPGQTRRHGATY